MIFSKFLSKSIFLSILFFSFAFESQLIAQQTASNSVVKTSTKKVNNDTKPEFPGGKLAFVEFLKTHIVYPDSAKAHSVVGQVIASFFINSDGSVTDITIVQGLGDGISEGVIESLKQMPRWKPATHNGKPIRAQYKVPINFNGK